MSHARGNGSTDTNSAGVLPSASFSESACSIAAVDVPLPISTMRLGRYRRTTAWSTCDSIAPYPGPVSDALHCSKRRRPATSSMNGAQVPRSHASCSSAFQWMPTNSDRSPQRWRFARSQARSGTGV